MPKDEPESAEMYDALVERVKQVTGRDCGECSLCCYVLDNGALDKPANKWCEACRPGKGGCSIYADRPPVCRGFACLWLTNKSFQPDWFPKRAKIVAHFEPDGNNKTILLALNVDPRYSSRWQEEPYRSDIQRFALKGLTEGFCGFNDSTRVYVGERMFLILPPDREIEITGEPAGLVVPTGPGQWERIRVKSAADGEELIRRVTALRAEAQRNPALRAALLQELERRSQA